MNKVKTSILKLENVSKIYKNKKIETVALKDINFEIFDNEFVAILGASGSGKSTLMNLIGCLDKPTRGKITLNNKDISLLSDSKLAVLRGKTLGFIFQQYNLISTLNAYNNVKLPLEFLNIDEKEADSRVEKILKIVNLEDKKNNFPGQLSGGQQQRVSIARCLVTNPQIILADEPTGALDSKTGGEILETLTKLWKNEKKTVIMITHDLNLVKYASRIIKLKDGQIIEDKKNEK